MPAEGASTRQNENCFRTMTTSVNLIAGRYYSRSNANIRFQSFFMLMTVQPLLVASS
jgi:hypothetical protein